MINLILKSVIDNSNKIDYVIDYINKHAKVINDKFALAGVGFIFTGILFKIQNNRIAELENELKEMKSKGE